jgi:hypothetical protein
VNCRNVERVMLINTHTSVSAKSDIIASLKNGLETYRPIFPQSIEYQLSPQC